MGKLLAGIVFFFFVVFAVIGFIVMCFIGVPCPALWQYPLGTVGVGVLVAVLILLAELIVGRILTG